MTVLDGAVIGLGVLFAAGCYRQGLIRGLMRVAALSAIGLLTVTFSYGVAIDGTLQAVLLRAGVFFGGSVLMIGALAWLLNRLIPPPFHSSLPNRVLGMVPPVVLGLLVVALALGLWHRLAFDQATQEYLARGSLTGRLIQPVIWLERAVAGVR